MIITLPSPASPAMAAVLRKYVAPSDIAPLASVFSMAQASQVTEVDGLVSGLNNLGAGAGDFTQATAGFRPAMAADAVLGRPTLTFSTDRSKFLTYNVPVSFTGAWSLLSVFRIDERGTGVCVLGSESAATSDRVNLTVANNGVFRARVTDAFAQAGGASNVLGQWYAGIASYNGEGRVSIWMPGRAVVAATAKVVPTGTTLYLGDNQTNFSMSGAVDLAARFELDLLDSANSALFGDVQNMLQRLYGGVVDGL